MLRLPKGPWRIAIHAIVATLLLVVAAIWRFDIAVSEMLTLLLLCVLGVLVLVIPAAGLGWLLQRRRRRDRD